MKLSLPEHELTITISNAARANMLNPSHFCPISDTTKHNVLISPLSLKTLSRFVKHYSREQNVAVELSLT